MATRHEKILTSLRETIANCDSIKATCLKALAVAEKGEEVSDELIAELNETEGEAQAVSSEMGHLIEIISVGYDDEG